MTKNRKIKCSHATCAVQGIPDRYLHGKNPSTPEPMEEWVEKFRKECGELWEYHSVTGAYTQAQEEVEQFISTLLSQQRQEIRERIGMLRQWLNEDRIKDGKYFVTNEQIERWLGLSTLQSGGEGKE